MHFKLMLRCALLISNEAKDKSLWQLCLSILYLFDSIFPGKVLIDKLRNFEEGICFPNNGYQRKRKQ